MELLAAIAASAPAQALKASFWVYPLVNAAHILGVALLVGAIAVVDLRLLGAFRGLPAAPLAAAGVPVAACGLALAAVTGILLFVVKPVDYAGSQIFLAKLAVVVLGLVNVALVRRSTHWRMLAAGSPGEADGRLHLAALGSLTLWIGALVLGRMVGYFL